MHTGTRSSMVRFIKEISRWLVWQNKYCVSHFWSVCVIITTLCSIFLHWLKVQYLWRHQRVGRLSYTNKTARNSNAAVLDTHPSLRMVTRHYSKYVKYTAIVIYRNFISPSSSSAVRQTYHKIGTCTQWRIQGGFIGFHWNPLLLRLYVHISRTRAAVLLSISCCVRRVRS